MIHPKHAEALAEQRAAAAAHVIPWAEIPPDIRCGYLRFAPIAVGATRALAVHVTADAYWCLAVTGDSALIEGWARASGFPEARARSPANLCLRPIQRGELGRFDRGTRRALESAIVARGSRPARGRLGPAAPGRPSPRPRFARFRPIPRAPGRS